MSRRQIPVATLALATTMACTVDPMIGDWQAVSVTYNGATESFPVEVMEVEGDLTFSDYFGYTMVVEDVDAVSFHQHERSVVGDLETSDTTNYYGTAVRRRRGEWELSFPMRDGLRLACVIDGDTADCAGDYANADPWAARFERLPMETP